MIDFLYSLSAHNNKRVVIEQVWPNSDITVQSCPICGLKRPLLLQIYAPLDSSQFHRTLYIFSCVNATCSSQSKGWLCIRVQQIENVTVQAEKDGPKSTRFAGGAAAAAAANIHWCSGANDWGDGGGGGAAEEIFTGFDEWNEQNGNVVNKMDNRYEFLKDKSIGL